MHKALVLLLLVICTASFSNSVNQKYIEAVFIHKFVNYITWEEERFKTQEIKVAVFEDQKIYDELIKISKKQKKSRFTLTVRQIKNLENIEDIHILIAGKELKLSSKLKHVPFLVTDNKEAKLENWNVIFKLNAENKLRFEINAKLARENKVFINSRLLKLGTKVIK